MISLVIPVFNEENTLSELVRRIEATMNGVQHRYEIVFVNDGSHDSSLNTILSLQEKNVQVKCVDLSRNFGHQAALYAGMEHASGDAIITMDADLQHPPELIPDLVEQWQAGYEVIITERLETADAGAIKELSSNLFYSLVNRLSSTKIIPGGADFRLMDRTAVDACLSLGEKNIFIRGVVHWIGFRQAVVTYSAPARYTGKSKFSVIKMVGLATDGITSLSSVPLYFSAYLGLLVSLLSFIYALGAIIIHFFTDLTVPGWTSIIAVILFIGGVQLVTMGIQGLYIGRIFKEVRGRPRYLIRATYGIDK